MNHYSKIEKKVKMEMEMEFEKKMNELEEELKYIEETENNKEIIKSKSANIIMKIIDTRSKLSRVNKITVDIVDIATLIKYINNLNDEVAKLSMQLKNCNSQQQQQQQQQQQEIKNSKIGFNENY